PAFTSASAFTDANGMATSPPIVANNTIGLYNITAQSGTASANFQLANQVPFDVPSTLNFAYILNKAVPPPQNLPVTRGTNSIPFTASTSAGWINLNPTSGTTPGNVAVSVSPGSTLGPGLHAGTVNLISPLATNSPLAVTVNLNINAQLTAPSNITITAM